ncbi:MAG: hypothetical protein ACTSYB_04790 [Candidatus Helarchaeota archaeon]
MRKISFKYKGFAGEILNIDLSTENFESVPLEGPYPCDSLALEVLKNFKKNIDSDYWIYNKKRIRFSDLKIPQEDALKGYYLDVDHETSLDEKIDETRIISIGMGRNTIFKKSLD